MTTESQQLYGSAVAVVRWLERAVLVDARGDDEAELERPPAGRFWLGRLGPEESASRPTGDRGERLDPCACGVRFMPAAEGPWEWQVRVGFRVWERSGDDAHPWRKSEAVEAEVHVEVPTTPGTHPFGEEQIADALGALGLVEHSARIDVEVDGADDRISVAAVLVNTTPDDITEPNLYETWLEIGAGDVRRFELDALPDSFRYDRTVEAFGISGGVERNGDLLRTTDVVTAERNRPSWWDPEVGQEPDLSFETLARDPLPSLRRLVEAAAEWGTREWSSEALDRRAEQGGWQTEMREYAGRDAEAFDIEVGLLEAGVEALADDANLLRAYQLMNEAMAHAARGRYPGWRPFQVGFQLVAIPSLADPDHERRRTVDTLWFATGGGKTETYLGLVVLTCLFDRIRGKSSGVSAWSRFPLRMLSLQQMQRFADALAGAELMRRREELGGAPIRLGFFVGASATPNRIRQDPSENEEDADDPDMPARYKRLDECPFCGERSVEMAWNARHWLLEHRCSNDACVWPDRALPIHIVDEEIFRLLPSVIVGTLDKAASVAWQAAMRGLIGAPLARCQGELHGFRYAPRAGNSDGCLVPGCRYRPAALGHDRELFGPSLRIQDELHLLRDSLGAVDSHYETLLDHLQASDGGPTPKIIASSATLTGHAEQVRILYRREGHVFPLPGPIAGASFWSQPTDALMRRFVGLGPRGQTLEYAADRIAAVLQRKVRQFLEAPDDVAAELGVEPDDLGELLSLYGTQVVYGSRLRDVEAAARSFGSEIPVSPLDYVTLTGGTPFDDVRLALDRLKAPEAEFNDRIHLIAASSMMSHGVDVDRLNVITMLGLPLTTAEFIQTTARIGRTHPGLVLVLHRMGGERDASVYRSFAKWIEHGDRFVEPVPITRRSKKVLALTYPGAFASRVYDVHEARSVRAGGPNLVRASRLKQYFRDQDIDVDGEYLALCEALGVVPDDQPDLAEEVRRYVIQTFRALEEPGDLLSNQLTGELPMTSLRDVEAQAPIVEFIPGGRRRR